MRIYPNEALRLYKDSNILTLGGLAHTIRTRLHPEKVITYIVDRNINYTNICISGCKFCAFYRDKNAPDAYLLDLKTLKHKIEETIALGGRQILLQGGLHPDLPLEYYEDLLQKIKHHHPIWIHGFSPPEIMHISNTSKLTVKEVIARLIKAGLDSIPGGGAEILVDRVRDKISPLKCNSEQWLYVMETAHGLGLKTTATMMFGHIETVEE
ncbi:MAG: radical SAM protein, partial [Pseudomonadota bacterium]